MEAYLLLITSRNMKNWHLKCNQTSGGSNWYLQQNCNDIKHLVHFFFFFLHVPCKSQTKIKCKSKRNFAQNHYIRVCINKLDLWMTHLFSYFYYPVNFSVSGRVNKKLLHIGIHSLIKASSKLWHTNYSVKIMYTSICLTTTIIDLLSVIK